MEAQRVIRTVHYRARIKTPGEFDTFKWQYLMKTGGTIHELPEYQAHWAARQLAKEHKTAAQVIAGVEPVSLYTYDRATGEVVEETPAPPPLPAPRAGASAPKEAPRGGG